MMKRHFSPGGGHSYRGACSFDYCSPELESKYESPYAREMGDDSSYYDSFYSK